MTDLTKIGREDLLRYVREELICTVGSRCVPLTVPVIITLFSEDTGQSIAELSKSLGYPSTQNFLMSDEVKDILVSDFSYKAIGINSKNDRELCLQARTDIPRVSHILATVSSSNDYQDQQKWRKMRMLLNDPKFQDQVLIGKIRLLTTLKALNGETDFVNYQSMQDHYFKENGVRLVQEELFKYFSKKHIKSVVGAFMFDDLEINTDKNRTGSLFFKMKRPFDIIVNEAVEASTARNAPKKTMPKKRNQSFQNRLPGKPKDEEKKTTENLVACPSKEKREKIPPPPPKAKIPPPPPKEKKPQDLVPLNQRCENLYTNDPNLAQAALSKKLEIQGLRNELEKEIQSTSNMKDIYYTAKVEKNNELNKNDSVQKSVVTRPYLSPPESTISEKGSARSRSKSQHNKNTRISPVLCNEETESDSELLNPNVKPKVKKPKPQFTKRGAGTYSDDNPSSDDDDVENYMVVGNRAILTINKDDELAERYNPNDEIVAELEKKFEKAYELRSETKNMDMAKVRLEFLKRDKQERAERSTMKLKKQFEVEASSTKFGKAKVKKLRCQSDSTKSCNANQNELDSDLDD